MNKYAGIIVIHKNSVLLAKRISFYKGELMPYPGYWSVFMGAIEEGESESDAAERELFEETELTIENPLVEIGSINDLVLFGTRYDDLVHPNLNFEHEECGWFDIDTLHSFPYKIDKKIINLILKCKDKV